MKHVDYAVEHYFVASDVGMALTRKASAGMMRKVKRCLESSEQRKKREGVVPYGISIGLNMILKAEAPGPTGMQLHLDIKRVLHHHNPSVDEMNAILKGIYDTLVPIWKNVSEENRQKNLKSKLETEARTRRLPR